MGSPANLLIHNNTFANNSPQSTKFERGGFIKPFWKGYLEISSNNISGTSGIFLSVNETPGLYFIVLDFHHNAIHSNRGRVVHFVRSDANHTKLRSYIHDNVAWDNTDALVDFLDPKVSWIDDFDALCHFYNNTVYRSPGTVFRNYGNLTIYDNVFVDCGGYVIDLQYLWRSQPRLYGNVFVRCGDAMSFKAIYIVPIRVLVFLYNMEIDCTGVALNLYRMEVTMGRVNISSSANPAIIADRSIVDAVDSRIEVGSAIVRFNGYVKVWFNVEADIEWASAAGAPSGNPVPGASVSFFNVTGIWSASGPTRIDGHLEPVSLIQWSLDVVSMDVYSPYKVMAAYSSFQANTSIILDHSYRWGRELHILIVDPFRPVVGISSPSDGEYLNSKALTVQGFAEDLGSGVMRVDLEIEGVNATTVVVDGMGCFHHVFTNVPEGDLVIRARVLDFALNEANYSISLVVDRTPPSLVVFEPLNDTHTNQSTVRVLGEYEPCKTVRVNLRAFAGTSGIIDVALQLLEGTNVIVVTATDRVGNVATVVRVVTLDTLAPNLRVFHPMDGFRTNSSDLELEGDVTGYHTLVVSVYRHSTDIINDPITPMEDGTYLHLVTLDEGENVIVVTARDRAGNTVSRSRTVTLDSVPPHISIIHPADGLVTNVRELQVLGEADPDGDLYLNGKRIPNNGKINKTVRLVEGFNIIELRAIDLMGNVGVVTVRVTLDTVPPSVNVTVPGTQLVRTNVAEIRIAGTIEGDAVGVSVANLPVDLIDGAFDTVLVLAGDGVHRIPVEARDLAGNTDMCIITVDLCRVPPTVHLTFDPPDDVIRNDEGAVTVRGATTGSASLVRIALSSADGDDNTTTVQLNGNTTFAIVLYLARGANTIVVTVEDVYGNTNTTDPHSVRYELPRDDPGQFLTTESLLAIPMIVAIVVLSAWLLSLRRRRKARRG